jgi:hypothetical protein
LIAAVRLTLARGISASAALASYDKATPTRTSMNAAIIRKAILSTAVPRILHLGEIHFHILL